MWLTYLERTLAVWKEEVELGPKKTELRPKHVKKLEKEIYRIYAMMSKVATKEETVKAWVDSVGYEQ